MASVASRCIFHLVSRFWVILIALLLALEPFLRSELHELHFIVGWSASGRCDRLCAGQAHQRVAGCEYSHFHQIDCSGSQALTCCLLRFVDIMDSSQRAGQAVESCTLGADASAEKSASGSLTLSPGCDLTLNPDASLSPEVSADNFVELPGRLRKHFLNIMHYAIKTQNWYVTVNHNFIYFCQYPFLTFRFSGEINLGQI